METTLGQKLDEPAKCWPFRALDVARFLEIADTSPSAVGFDLASRWRPLVAQYCPEYKASSRREWIPEASVAQAFGLLGRDAQPVRHRLVRQDRARAIPIQNALG